MREIKFRGKILKVIKKYHPCKVGEWAYGDLLHAEHSFVKGTDIIPDDFSQVVVDESTVGQFTGMHDDDGTEIWEGDIVRMTEKPYNLEYIGKVTYNAGLGCYRLAVDEGDRSMRLDFIKSDIVNDGKASVPVKYFYKVIGNVYDNPELLKK